MSGIWLHTNFRQIKVSCNGERRRLLVTEVKWWHENELTGRMQLILFLSKRCCSRAYGKSNVTFRSCWEELNTEHEQISQDLKGLVLWSIHTLKFWSWFSSNVVISILFTCSWSHPPSWPSSCFRVSAVRRTCLAHVAGIATAVGLGISPIPVLSYSEPPIEF